jgi:glycine/D-amino acid oxidase-like deaminating enzyme
MAQKSMWRGARKQNYKPLDGSCTVDIAIVGGGLTGITAAYMLRDSGLSIAVLEGGAIGSEASGSTTAFLMELIDTRAVELTGVRGIEEARMILDSHRDAINFYEHAISSEQIECEFMRCPTYCLAHAETEVKGIRQEYYALQKLGRGPVFRDGRDLPIVSHGYIRLDNQAKLHPLNYLYGLADAAHRKGVGIFENVRVTSISQSGSMLELATPAGTVEAKRVLMATHYPMEPQPSSLFFKKAAYLTYVLEVSIPRGTLPEALYEDTANPYHYVRVDKGEKKDRLIVGGEDHRLDIPVPEEKCFAALKKYVHDVLPNVDIVVVREWKGRIVEPGDGLAFLGPLENPQLFYATGYSGNGLTYAVIAAGLFRDHVLGRSNPFQKIYAANRTFNPKAYIQSAEHYLGEFVGGAVKNIFK